MAPQLYYRTESQPNKWKRVRKDRKQPNRSSLTRVHKLIPRPASDVTETLYVKNRNAFKWTLGQGRKQMSRRDVAWLSSEHEAECTTWIERCDCDWCTAEVPEAYCPPEPRVEVDIMDIARMAKAKGIAKEYEILDPPRRILVEDHFVLEECSDEYDWERIDDEQVTVPRSYSAVVGGYGL